MTTVLTAMIVSAMMFGSGLISTFENRVTHRRKIAADEDEYDWQIVLCGYGHLPLYAYFEAYSNDVINIEIFHYAGQFVQ